MLLILFSLALLSLAAWVLAPILGEGVWSSGARLEDDPDELRRQRDTALGGLRDLEMDRAMGKIEEIDYRRERAEYEGEALRAIQGLEELDLSDRRAGRE